MENHKTVTPYFKPWEEDFALSVLQTDHVADTAEQGL